MRKNLFKTSYDKFGHVRVKGHVFREKKEGKNRDTCSTDIHKSMPKLRSKSVQFASIPLSVNISLKIQQQSKACIW